MKKKAIAICAIVLIVVIGIFCLVNALSVPKIEKKDNHILFENADNTTLIAEKSCGIFSGCATDENNDINGPDTISGIKKANEDYISTNKIDIEKLNTIYNDTKNLSVSNKFISDKKNLMIEIEKLKKDIQKNNVNLNKVNSTKLYN